MTDRIYSAARNSKLFHPVDLEKPVTVTIQALNNESEVVQEHSIRYSPSSSSTPQWALSVDILDPRLWPLSHSGALGATIQVFDNKSKVVQEHLRSDNLLPPPPRPSNLQMTI